MMRSSRLGAPLGLFWRGISTHGIRSGGIGRRGVRGRAGFTLIEVVVALAVIAVGLTAIGTVAASSVRGTRSLEQHLALVQTTRVVAATLPRTSDASLDGLTGDILGFRWRISLVPFVGSSGVYRPPDSQWIPQTVVVRVRSPSGAVHGFETVRLLQKPQQR